jgi:hypothetical protein
MPKRLNKKEKTKAAVLDIQCEEINAYDLGIVQISDSYTVPKNTSRSASESGFPANGHAYFPTINNMKSNHSYSRLFTTDAKSHKSHLAFTELEEISEIRSSNFSELYVGFLDSVPFAIDALGIDPDLNLSFGSTPELDQLSGASLLFNHKQNEVFQNKESNRNGHLREKLPVKLPVRQNETEESIVEVKAVQIKPKRISPVKKTLKRDVKIVEVDLSDYEDRKGDKYLSKMSSSIREKFESNFRTDQYRMKKIRRLSELKFHK